MGFVIPLDSEVSKEKGFNVDLEIGANSIVSGKERRISDVSCIAKAAYHQKPMSVQKDLCRVDDRPSENGKIRWFLGEKMKNLVENKSGSKERLEEIKSVRKPSKPPKPSKTLLLDAAEKKMAREMSELAFRKRLRMERMKSIRNMKNADAGFNSDKLCVLVVTFLFCVVIIWHGITSRGNSAVKSHGSREPALLHYGVQHH